jgi:ectoine hydroxylase-related dioxygenase (phytanoyl-CoA dioxygenase family)
MASPGGEPALGARPGPARHALNTSFSWTPTGSALRRVTPAQAARYDEDGFFVLADAFDAGALAEMVAEIDPFEQETEALLRQVEGGKVFIARADEITFTTFLVARSARLRRLVAQPPLTDLCADLLGPDVRLYWDQAVYKKPDTAASFPWHQDNGYAFVEPQQYLTCWIALTDATEDNGCPWVVPGLHRRGTLRHELTETGLVCLDEAPDAVAVPVRAGSVVVFSSLTPHATGPNRTDAVRKAYIVQYAPDGAAVLTGPDGQRIEPAPAQAPDRQFPVLVGGRAVG